MNQIIYQEGMLNSHGKNISLIINSKTNNSSLENKEKINASNKRRFLKIKDKYRLQFFISLGFAIVFIALLLYHFYQKNEQEKISKLLLKNYNLTTLYQNNASNIPNAETTSLEINDDLSNLETSNVFENPFVIGMICIDKIDLNYPILSESNKELLKISLCRFAGPMPNEYGNLCIAGHNYVDNRFFSKLNKLSKNDIIKIYDLNGKKAEYSVFKKYEVYVNDLSCTNQNVGKEKIITLLTCNNVNGKRTIIKAKETST